MEVFNMGRYFFLNENCQYKYNRNERTLKFRFNYKKNSKVTNDGTKYRISSCTRYQLPFILDRKFDLRLNAVVRKTKWEEFKREIAYFYKYYGVEIVDPYHNSKLKLVDDLYIEIEITKLDFNESSWWVSQTRKSKVVSSFNTWDVPLPFSNHLEIYFTMFIRRENLDDENDFDDNFDDKISLGFDFDNEKYIGN